MPLHRRLGSAQLARLLSLQHNGRSRTLAAALRETSDILASSVAIASHSTRFSPGASAANFSNDHPSAGGRLVWTANPPDLCTARTLLASTTYSFATIRNRPPGRSGMSPELTEYMTEIREHAVPAASRSPREVHRRAARQTMRRRTESSMAGLLSAPPSGRHHGAVHSGLSRGCLHGFRFRVTSQCPCHSTICYCCRMRPSKRR